MWRVAVRGGFIHQTLALQNAETVLLVNRHKTKSCELDLFFDQCVCADDELRFSGANALERRLLLRKLESADEQLYTIAGFSQNTARRKKVLDREDFRRGHKRSLGAVFDRDDRGLQCNNGFPAPDVTLQQAIHWRRLFQVGNDFRKDALLRLRRLEREDALQRFADAVFPH